MLSLLRRSSFKKYVIPTTLIFYMVLAPFSFAAQEQPLAYLSESQLPPTLLVPPPHEGTREEDMQLELVRAAQKNISDTELADMRDEQHVRLAMMTTVLSASFTRDNLPLTFALLDRVLQDTGRIVDADKRYWHTRRPYLVNDKVRLLIDPIDDSPSYPSGHTCASRVLADVLAMLLPDKRAVLSARADEIAQHRVMAGVHYPVDLAGGRSLADAIVRALVTNDAFNRDLAAARAELLAHAQVGK